MIHGGHHPHVGPHVVMQTTWFPSMLVAKDLAPRWRSFSGLVFSSTLEHPVCAPLIALMSSSLRQ
jgi:hypothetical protein